MGFSLMLAVIWDGIWDGMRFRVSWEGMGWDGRLAPWDGMRKSNPKATLARHTSIIWISAV